MGLRFRKSINLGCGLRVNLSRSGVGYSWGGKGFRVSRSARGRVTRTYSIPGTGISYSTSSSSRSERSGNRTNRRNVSAQSHLNSGSSYDVNNGLGATTFLQNAPIEMLGDEEYKVLSENAKKFAFLTPPPL